MFFYQLLSSCPDSSFLKDQYEEIDIVMKGENYGWPFYEGPFLSNPEQSSKGNASYLKSTNFIRPVLGYNHSQLNTSVKSASVSGGYVYRSKTDPCLYGRFVCFLTIP